MTAGLLEGMSGTYKTRGREASKISSNLHVFVSMGYDWPVDINIDNKHTVGAANYIVVNELKKKLQLCFTRAGTRFGPLYHWPGHLNLWMSHTT